MDCYEAAEMLKRMGLHRIGAGLYAEVYGRDGCPFVYKVWGGTDTWIDYIRWATANGYAGSFAPRVYGIRRLGELCLVAKMERLKPIPYPLYRDFWQDRNFGMFLGFDCFYKRLSNALGQPFDTHPGNWMVNENYTRVVLTDPILNNICARIKKRWNPASELKQGRLCYV